MTRPTVVALLALAAVPSFAENPPATPDGTPSVPGPPLAAPAVVNPTPTAKAVEEPAPTNFIAGSVAGFAGFLRLNIGSYEISYEHVFGHHGVHLAFDFIHVHHAGGYIESHQWTFGAAFTYRFYLFEKGLGPFAGLRLGLRRGTGKYGVAGAADHTMLTNEQSSVIGQFGFRVLPAKHVAITVRGGIGYGPYTVRADRADAEGANIARLSRDLLAPQPLVFDTELSFAFAF